MRTITKARPAMQPLPGAVKKPPVDKPGGLPASWEPLIGVDLKKLNSPRKPAWVCAAWKNKHVWVQEQQHRTAYGIVRHLYIGRIDTEPLHNWQILQQVKNEIAGPEAEAVEIYPPHSRLVNAHNIYHLYVLPPGTGLPFGMALEPKYVQDIHTVLPLTAYEEPEQ